MIDAGAAERARTLLELDHDARARDLLTELLRDDPDDPELLCMLAQACLGTHDPAAAARAAERAAATTPDDEWPLRLGALARARLGQGADARALARRAVELDPDNWCTHYVAAQIAVQFAGPRGTAEGTAEGEAAAREAIRLDPTNADCHEVLGDLLLSRQRASAAAAAYAEALRLDPDHAGAQHGLALTRLRRGDLGRAAVGFAAAAAADPADQRAATNLVVLGSRLLEAVHWVMTTAVAAAVLIDSPSRVPAVIGFAVVAAALVVAGVLLRRGAGSRLIVLARVIAGRERALGVWSGLLVVAFACHAAAAFGPQRYEVVALNTSFLVLMAWALVHSLRTRR